MYIPQTSIVYKPWEKFQLFSTLTKNVCKPKPRYIPENTFYRTADGRYKSYCPGAEYVEIRYTKDGWVQEDKTLPFFFEDGQKIYYALEDPYQTQACRVQYNCVIRRSKNLIYVTYRNFVTTRKFKVEESVRSSFDELMNTKRMKEVLAKILHKPEIQYVRSKSSIVRARRSVRELIDCNYTKFTKFVTFTFKENVTDMKEARKAFKDFMRSFKMKFGMPFKSVRVTELQQRGAIHFHCVLFIEKYLPFKELKALWGKYGSLDIKAIKCGSEAVTKYVCKYITMDFVGQKYNPGDRLYTCTQNLIRPTIERIHCSNSLPEDYFFGFKLDYQYTHFLVDDNGQYTELYTITQVFVAQPIKERKSEGVAPSRGTPLVEFLTEGQEPSAELPF